jgi:DNA end-binding protein Ku
MARAIWSGAISFGLVTVPVKLYSAINRKTVRFHQLSGTTGARIAQKRVDPQSNEEVPYENVVKGYEIAPERYVRVEQQELDSLSPEKTRTIDIEDFVELAQIDPIYYDHPYYLVPGPGGAKPYRLLLQAMERSGRVAIARVVIRSKEQLVAVRPMGEVLGMATMLFADEILPPERLEELPDSAQVKVTKREVEIAMQLVDSLAPDFEPQKYRDTYRDEVLALIERKAQGEEIAVAPPPEEVRVPAPDLMSALKASLEAVRAREGAGAPQPAGNGAAAAEGDGRTKARKAPTKKPAGAKSPSKKAARKAPRTRTPAKR